jgi:hypothetical protein
MYITNVSFFLHIKDPRLLPSPDFAATAAAELAAELPN